MAKVLDRVKRKIGDDVYQGSGVRILSLSLGEERGGVLADSRCGGSFQRG